VAVINIKQHSQVIIILIKNKHVEYFIINNVKNKFSQHISEECHAVKT